MSRFLLVCLGGALGTGARYLVVLGAPLVFGRGFPYGTLIVNVVGSFLIGAVMHVSLTSSLASPTLQTFLTTGVMGGFTTYSAFNEETLQYLRDGALGLGALNAGVTLALCLLAGVLGAAAARAFAG